MLKKGFKFIIIVLAVLLVGLFIFLSGGKDLPPETDSVISSLLASDVPELAIGKTGFAKSGDLEIWYEEILPKDSIKGTVLLVMGHSSTAMVWSNEFCQFYVDAGYRVIRYDNRDVGMSTWVDNWSEEDPYTIEDMASDAIAILDDVGADDAHIIGVSMGGMIAQRLAISHPQRVKTLTSIMSSAYMLDPEISPVPWTTQSNATRLFIKYLLNASEADYVKFFIGIEQAFGGDDSNIIDVEQIAVRTLYELRNRKGFNINALNQHSKAIEISGSRLQEVANIDAPTLVIHGNSDPLVNVAHSKKYAPHITNAETLYLDKMGHNIPTNFLKQVNDAIIRNLARTN